MLVYFTIATLSYITFLYLLVAFKVNKKYPDYKKSFSVIIPCYNEEPRYLEKCIDSIINSEGEKQIILIDNNSNDKSTTAMIDSYRKNNQILVLVERRQGKRFAHSKGIKYAENDLIVFVDSDTIVGKKSFLELIKPMQDEKIGAVCGNIKIANHKENFFTKCLDTMYWNSFEFYRYATSSISYLYVCSGALSCYRKKLLMELEEEYLNQKFLGKPCSISDDTFQTVRIQSRFGKNVTFSKEALAYTYSPSTFKGFWKQLVRWRLGFLRESILMWKEPKNNIKFLFADAQYNLITQLCFVFFRIFILAILIFNFSFFLLSYVVLSVVLGSIFLSIYQIMNRPTKIFYILSYNLLYEFIFIFTYLEAIAKIRHQGKWNTR